MKRNALTLIVTVISLVVLGQTVMATEYPTKPIEIMVPFGAGGVTDILSRLVAKVSPKYLGQPMVVINRPGSSGAIGASVVVTSKPDGYKLLATDHTFFAMTTKTQKLDFDSSHLVPIANFIELKRGMAVRGDSPWNTLSDLLDYARKNPGKIDWTHPGRGLAGHLNALLIFRKAGVVTVDIPYKGNPEMVAALLGGHVHAISIPYTPVKDHIRTGKVRYLVTYSSQRFSDPSGVPSAAELGFPEAAKLSIFIGLYCHKDTPLEIRKTLLDAFRKTYEDPEFKKGVQDIGEEPSWKGPEDLADDIKKTEEIGIPIIKELGLYMAR